MKPINLANKQKVLVEWAKDQETFLIQQGAIVSEIYFTKWGRCEFVTNNQFREFIRIKRKTNI